MSRYIRVPATVAEKRRRVIVSNQLARARYETRHPNRSHHNTINEKAKRDQSWLSRPFVMWDGEGPKDAGYALFGSSEGDELCRPHLGTAECLNLILSRASQQQYIHFWFGGNYDVSMILHELPKRHLRTLHNTTRTIWKGYQLEHIPHKWFKIKYGLKTCKIYDVRSFFFGKYQNALNDFGIGTDRERQQIDKGKGDRESFVWAEIEYIKRYWRLELKLGPQLMGRMREIFAEVGYVPRSWHGPGALARMALKKHHVYDAMAVCPELVQEASQYAFAGGHFELFIAGHIQGQVYNADIHSAYPYFATHLPNLNNGKWRETRNYEAGKFAVYHIRYDAKPENGRIFPLFRRMSNGCVVWPSRVEGWYWAPEANLVKDDPDAEIIEGWVFDEDDPTDRPFAWMAEYYDWRNRLKGEGNAAEFTIKLIINAVYGQLAQRAGWNRKDRTPPKSHQLEWAGYITSACRAAIYQTATRLGSKLVSVDTDGIYAIAPIPCDNVGGSLGQWEQTEYVDGVFWQSGIYCLKKDNDTWKQPKSRGIKRGSYKPEDLLACVYNNKKLELSRRTFYSYGLADIHGWDKLNTWEDQPHEYGMGGGKRIHFERACKTHCDPPIHRLAQWEPSYGLMPDDDPWSYKHKLPWLADDDNTCDNEFQEWEFLTENHLDTDDEWMITST